MMNNTKKNFWLDVCLLVSYLISILTGLLLWLAMPRSLSADLFGINRIIYLTIHVFSGIFGLSGVVLHVVWHRGWLKALRGRSIKELPKKLRGNRIVDRVIWIAFLSTITFGAYAFLFDQNPIIPSMADRLHTASSVVLMLTVVVHLVFHRKWISNVISRFIKVKNIFERVFGCSLRKDDL